jgi:tRNA G37 N-methylase TrmD
MQPFHLEQETQRMRTERCDLIKKLQHQQEEAKKVLQQQIEFK